ncbi:hypothetical protein B0H11DRAFT_1215043 [Mycena galericulata]|nr:hypothetical protein B0H11DRAFT_1215043 [Mycena galericulata]
MATILTMFLIALVLWALDFANFFIETKMTLVENINEPLSSKRNNAFVLIVRLTAVQDALYAYMSLLGDGIILYRVWTLNAYHRPWIFFLPCACLVGSSVATGMLTYCVAGNGSDIVLGSFENPAFCKNIQTVTYIMPCVTTAIATVLIGVTTWKYRRSIKNLRINSITSSENNTRSRRTQAERILVLLVESGLLYFVFFISQAIESPSVHDWIKSQPEASFATLFQYCSSVFVGLYPTIVLVLAHSKHTVVDGISTASHGDSSSLQTSSNPDPITFRAVRRRNDEEIELESGLNGQRDRLQYD